MLFLHLLDSSKAAVSFTSGFLRRQTARDGVSFGEFQMGPDLVVEFNVKLSVADERE
jgi:hypothetical protein